ncbi:MAG: type II secretion system GspH family protein [Victivallales bacterium]|nr:type II secretion system GspH family protein [Victivallales bacterium]
MKKNKFTLIELLTVIAIFIILMSILIPAVIKVRTRAKITRETVNLKQIYQAVIFYSEENSDYFPYLDAIADDDNVSKTIWLLLPHLNYDTKLISFNKKQMNGRRIYSTATSSTPEDTPLPGFSYVPVYTDGDSQEHVLRFNDHEIPNIPVISTPKNKYLNKLVYLTFNGEVE